MYQSFQKLPGYQNSSKRASVTHLRSEMNLLQVSEELQKTLQLGFWEMSIKKSEPEWSQNFKNKMSEKILSLTKCPLFTMW